MKYKIMLNWYKKKIKLKKNIFIVYLFILSTQISANAHSAISIFPQEKKKKKTLDIQH